MLVIALRRQVLLFVASLLILYLAYIAAFLMRACVLTVTRHAIATITILRVFSDEGFERDGSWWRHVALPFEA